MWPTLLVIAAMVVAGVGVGCSSPLDGITPGPAIQGTWKTPLPVPVYYTSDFCGNGPETVGQSNWSVTWTISGSGDATKATAEMYQSGNGEQFGMGSCYGAAGWVPFVSPTGIDLTISGTAITGGNALDGITFTGSFTSNYIMGTFVQWDCLLYCTGEFTMQSALKLERQ